MSVVVQTTRLIFSNCLSSFWPRAVFSVMAGAADKQTRNDATGKIEPLPRDLEIQLALSALPPHLRDHATVYVLNPDKGFEVARTGTNGFHAFVCPDR